jgi:hypothetical protein
MTRRNPIDRPWASRSLRRLQQEIENLNELLAEGQPLSEAGHKKLERQINQLLRAVETGDVPPAVAVSEVADINRALIAGSLGIAESGVTRPMPGTRQAPLRPIEERHPQADPRQRAREREAGYAPPRHMMSPEEAPIATVIRRILQRTTTPRSTEEAEEFARGQREAIHDAQWGLLEGGLRAINMNDEGSAYARGYASQAEEEIGERVEHLQRRPAARDLDEVREEAELAVEARGHAIEWLLPRYYTDDESATQIGRCSECGRDVFLNTRPPPNGIEISGEAVSLECAHNMLVEIDLDSDELDILQSWYSGQGDPLYTLQSSYSIERNRIDTAITNLSHILNTPGADLGDDDIATIEGLIRKLERVP